MERAVTEHDNEQEIIEAGASLEPVDNSDGSPDNPAFSAPLKRDSKGRFIKGTGTRGHLGGRPKGARDKITTTMIRLAEDVAAEYGEEMFKTLAKHDPAACLALITRLLPNPDLSKAIEGEEQTDQPVNVTINLQPARPAHQQVERDKVERLSHLSEDDKDFIREVVEDSQPSTEKAEEFPPIDMNAPPPRREKAPMPRTDGGYKRGGSQGDRISDHNWGRETDDVSESWVTYPDDNVI
jgi:hypothetical protein